MQNQQQHTHRESTDTSVVASANREHGPTSSHTDVRRDYAYYQQIFHDHLLPFAYIDLDLLDQNMREISRACSRETHPYCLQIAEE